MSRTKTANSLTGDLNPESLVGFATITEHVAVKVLGNAIKMKLGAPYDLLSDSIGKVNVKYSALHNSDNSIYWVFSRNANGAIPDYYLCLGFDLYCLHIICAWLIPSNVGLFEGKRILVSATKHGKFGKYRINHQPYEDVYQNLDIRKLSEFSNYEHSRVPHWTDKYIGKDLIYQPPKFPIINKSYESIHGTWIPVQIKKHEQTHVPTYNEENDIKFNSLLEMILHDS